MKKLTKATNLMLALLFSCGCIGEESPGASSGGTGATTASADASATSTDAASSSDGVTGSSETNSASGTTEATSTSTGSGACVFVPGTYRVDYTASSATPGCAPEDTYVTYDDPDVPLAQGCTRDTVLCRTTCDWGEVTRVFIHELDLQLTDDANGNSSGWLREKITRVDTGDVIYSCEYDITYTRQ